MATSPLPQNRWPLVPASASGVRAAPSLSGRIELSGELDLASADRARGMLAAAPADSRSVVCDLSGLSFIDVRGLHVLLEAAAHARLTGGHLRFAHCPASLRRLLGLLGLERALAIEAAALSGRSGSRVPEDRAPVQVTTRRIAL